MVKGKAQQTLNFKNKLGPEAKPVGGHQVGGNVAPVLQAARHRYAVQVPVHHALGPVTGDQVGKPGGRELRPGGRVMQHQNVTRPRCPGPQPARRLQRQPQPLGVEFAGFSPDPVDKIETFDVGLLPSKFPNESLPTVIMEYLFCGKPAIATNVGEIREMLRTPDGELAGTLLDFDGNQISTDQLAAAMQTYFDDPALRRRHAALAPAAFAKFEMGKCASAYAQLYAELVAGAPIKSSTSASH